MENNIESTFVTNNNELIHEDANYEAKSTVNVNLNKVLEWAMYVLGMILILIALYYFLSDLELRYSGDIYEFKQIEYVGGDAYNFIISAARSGAIMTKGLIMAVLGCSAIIIGRLSAILNKMK